jgi:hypothetical protein
MKQHNGNDAGAIEKEINATLLAGALDVFEKDGHRLVRLGDIVLAAVDAAHKLGLEGEEAERMAEYIQRELVECLADNGIGIIDTEDGNLWLPGTEADQ